MVTLETTNKIDFNTVQTGMYYVAPNCTYENSPLTPNEIEKISIHCEPLMVVDDLDHREFRFMCHDIHYAMKKGSDMWHKIQPLPMTIEQRLDRVEKKLGL